MPNHLRRVIPPRRAAYQPSHSIPRNHNFMRFPLRIAPLARAHRFVSHLTVLLLVFSSLLSMPPLSAQARPKSLEPNDHVAAENTSMFRGNASRTGEFPGPGPVG